MRWLLTLLPVACLAGNVELRWDPSPDGVAGYRVYWET